MVKRKSILVIGLGRFGASIADDLWEAGMDVTVIDQSADVIEPVKERSGAAFVGDATSLDVLKELGVSDMEAVVVSFGQHFETSVLCVASLKQLEVQYIVARAETSRQAAILKTVGANRVVQLEQDMGKRLANELIAPVTQELLDFAEHYRVLPWSASGSLVGSTLADAKLTSRYQISVLGYRRRDEHVQEGQRPRLHIPTPSYEIQEGDTLLIVGEADNVNRFVEEVGQ